MQRSIWRSAGAARSRVDMTQPVSLTRDGRNEIRLTEGASDGSVIVIPITPLRQVIGVALVPPHAVGQVTHNQITLPPGIHELRHADRLDVDGQTFWISVDLAAEQTQYDPARHPPDAFCFLTKARLNEGDPVVVCPGTPETPCGVIYSQAAWAAARKSPTPFKCPNCGFDPARATWEPPAAEAAQESLDELLQRIANTSP